MKPKDTNDVTSTARSLAIQSALGMVLFAGGMGVYFNSWPVAIACIGGCVFFNSMVFVGGALYALSKGG